MLRFQILYNEKQEFVVDTFLEFCRVNGYNRLAGLKTLLELANYHKTIQVLADKIVDLNKAIGLIQAKLDEQENKVKKPVGMGASLRGEDNADNSTAKN